MNSTDSLNNEEITKISDSYDKKTQTNTPTIKTFKKTEEIKTKKFKLKKIAKYFTCVVPLLVAISVIIGPYIQNDFTNKSYVQTHSNTEISMVDNTDAYVTNPYIYEGDVKAFIEAPGIFNNTYPVVQTDNNDYYLNHDINGNQTKVGAIFKDSNNNEGLSDDLTIIYGHNLLDDSNFGKLADYADKETNNIQVRDAQDAYDVANQIDYKDEYGHYNIDIFASGIYDASYIVDNVGSFDSQADFNQIIEYIKNNSDIETDITPNYGDKIVCFFTCPDGDADDYYGKTGQNENNRTLVFGVAKQLEKYQELPQTKSGKTL